MTSNRKLRADDLVVCTDGGNAPLLGEGVWQVMAVHDPKHFEYPVMLVRVSPRPPLGHVESRQTTTYRVQLFEEVWPDLRLDYGPDLSESR